MRLLVKQGKKLAQIFLVNFRKSQHWSVIGEHLLFDHLEAMIPEGTNFHSHFIYVENGDYHFSFKYYNTIEKQFIDRKTYYNHIATKKGPSPNFDKDTHIERRDINPENPLDCFMMGEKLKPWTVRPLGHHFGTIALNLKEDKLKSLNWDGIQAKEDDLIIDLDITIARVMNFGVSLYSQGNAAFEASQLPEHIIMIEKAIAHDDLILKLSVIIAE